MKMAVALLALGMIGTGMNAEVTKASFGAAKNGKPVAIVNQGETRGDAHAAVRLDLPLGPTLTGLAEQLGAAAA